MTLAGQNCTIVKVSTANENLDVVDGASERPTMRGALHAWAVLPFLVAGLSLLLAASAEERWPILAYVLSVVACLGTSALYHRVAWRPPGMPGCAVWTTR